MAIVGDLVDGGVEELREDVALLADLVSEQGVYFVTGNHEYFVDTEPGYGTCPTLGVDVLRNERVTLRRGTPALISRASTTAPRRPGVPGHGANLEPRLDGRDSTPRSSCSPTSP